MITLKYLIGRSGKAEVPENNDSPKQVLPLEVVEEKCIRNALEYCKGNVVKASELLQIGKATIYRKITKYDIDLNLYNDKLKK